MASFPAPFPTNNPSIGAAAGAAEGASSIYNSLQNRLQSAASRQATLQRQKNDKADADYRTGLQRDFDNQRLLANEGYVPNQVYPNGDPTPGRPTLMTPEANPAAQGGGPSITDPNGRQYTKKPALDKTNSFVAPAGSVLEGWLQNEAGIEPNTPIPMSHVPALLELHKGIQAANAPEDVEPVPGKFQGPDGQQALLQRGKRTGKIQAAQLPSGYSVAETPDKPDVSQILQGVQGPNGGPLIFDHTTQTLKEIPPVPGSKGVLTAAQTEADKDRHTREADLNEARNQRMSDAEQRRADAQQARENQAGKDHEAAGLKKQAMQAMAQGYYDAAGTNAGATYFPPRYVNGIVTPGPATIMPSDKDQLADRRKALHAAGAGFDRTAATHQAEQERIEKAHGWGKFAPAQAPVQQPVQTGAAKDAGAQTALPTGHKVGDTVQLKNGQSVKIKKIYGNGTFDY